MENKLSNIINSIEANGNQGEAIDSNLLNIILSHIVKEKQNNQIIFNKFNTNQEKRKQELASLHNKFLENKNNFNSVQKLLDEYSRNKDKFLTFKDIKDLSKNIDMISSKLKEFSKKQDLEILKKDINSKLLFKAKMINMEIPRNLGSQMVILIKTYLILFHTC